jgi:hypothetical protein
METDCVPDGAVKFGRRADVETDGAAGTTMLNCTCAGPFPPVGGVLPPLLHPAAVTPATTSSVPAARLKLNALITPPKNTKIAPHESSGGGLVHSYSG